MKAMERNKTEEGDRECWYNLKSVVRKRRPKERSCEEVSSGGGRSNCEDPEQRHLVFSRKYKGPALLEQRRAGQEGDGQTGCIELRPGPSRSSFSPTPGHRPGERRFNSFLFSESPLATRLCTQLWLRRQNEEGTGSVSLGMPI